MSLRNHESPNGKSTNFPAQRYGGLFDILYRAARNDPYRVKSVRIDFDRGAGNVCLIEGDKRQTKIIRLQRHSHKRIRTWGLLYGIINRATDWRAGLSERYQPQKQYLRVRAANLRTKNRVFARLHRIGRRRNLQWDCRTSCTGQCSRRKQRFKLKFHCYHSFHFIVNKLSETRSGLSPIRVPS